MIPLLLEEIVRAYTYRYFKKGTIKIVQIEDEISTFDVPGRKLYILLVISSGQTTAVSSREIGGYVQIY